MYNELGILKYGACENTTITLYTVPSGKVFSLQGFSLQNSDGSVGGQTYLSVNLIDFASNIGRTGTNAILNISLPKPIIYPSGTIFKVRSEILNCFAIGLIYGTESNNTSLYSGN